MKRKLGVWLALNGLMLFALGCVSTPRGVQIGLPGQDTIVSRYELPHASVKAAAITVLERNGTLISDDLVTKVLEARVNNARVFVEMDDSEPRITKVSVQVRRGASADVDLASEIDKQIYGQLIIR